MKKQTYEIGSVFTYEENEYKTQEASKVECNKCKGCDFFQVIRLEEYPYHACGAPNDIRCSAPDRIFKQIK